MQVAMVAKIIHPWFNPTLSSGFTWVSFLYLIISVKNISYQDPEDVVHLQCFHEWVWAQEVQVQWLWRGKTTI